MRVFLGKRISTSRTRTTITVSSKLQAKQVEENILLRAENKQMRAQLEVAVTGQHGELDEKDIALNAEQKDKLKTSRKYKAKI